MRVAGSVRGWQVVVMSISPNLRCGNSCNFCKPQPISAHDTPSDAQSKVAQDELLIAVGVTGGEGEQDRFVLAAHNEHVLTAKTTSHRNAVCCVRKAV